MADDHVCRICMAEVSDATSIKGCSHVFCYHCVHQWTSTRRTPLCPICRAAITALVLADGTEEAAKPSTTAAESEEPDLSCLDHSYFLGEVGRLLSRANSVHNRLYSEAYGCGRKGDRQTERSLDSIQDVLGMLSSYRSTLHDEVRFDPAVLLQDLYRLDRQLTSMSQAGTPHGGHSAAAAAGGGEQWYADDCYEEDDSWHEEADEDDWHQGLAKTPGRRPTNRHVQRNGGQQQRR